MANRTKSDRKTRFALLDFGFLGEMARNMAKGLKSGRAPGDWMGLEWDQETEDQYMNALLRHTLEDFNPAAIACNAMIIWWHTERPGRLQAKLPQEEGS
jgi:hypothetical protein